MELAALGLYCQDHRSIFFQYGPEIYMYELTFCITDVTAVGHVIEKFCIHCCLHGKFVCDPGSVHVTYGSYSQISSSLDYCAAGMNISRTREKKKHSIKKRQIKRRKSKHEFNSAFLNNKVMCQAFETLIMY